MRGDGDLLTARPERDAASLRILVAEDNPVNQFLLLTILEAAGCQVHVAGDGKAAIELILSHEYDLILMDQQMPGMDGPQTVAAIRQLDINVASLPIIAISTDTDGSDQFRAGVDDFVAKPFDPVRLFDAISRVTGFMPSAPALADIVAGLAAIHEPAPSIAPVAVNPDLY
jgi:CheY-like chemotaxis protein